MKDVEIYPSSWYYNACVHGFLEVLAWGLGDKGRDIVEEQFLQDDGSVRIPGELMEAVFSTIDVPAPAGYTFREVPNDVKELKRIAWWWVVCTGELYLNTHEQPVTQEIIDIVFDKYLAGEGTKPISKYLNELGYKTADNKKWGAKDISQIVANRNSHKILPENQKNIALMEFVFRQAFSKDKMYQNLTQLTSNKTDFFNDWFTCNVDEGQFHCSFCNSLCTVEEQSKNTFFSLELSKTLGDSVSEFPNLFWNNNPTLPMCKQCRSYFIFFHFINETKYFVNSDSLKINWYLNRLLHQKMSGSYQKGLFKAISYDNQLRSAVGSWGLQNMEVVLFQKGIANIQPISEHLAKLLLIPRISSLLDVISNSLVWDIVFQERFSYLLNLTYKQLRFFLSGKDNKSEDPEIIAESWKSMSRVTTLLELFYAIRQVEQKEKGGKGLASIDFRQIREEAKKSPISVTDNAGKGLVFRLLELTRLNKKTEVYHLLLRTYAAKGSAFPASLANLFTINDPEIFQTGIYAYIAGLSKEHESQLLTEGGVNDEG
jgi:CRISPR-associated protein Cst1